MANKRFLDFTTDATPSSSAFLLEADSVNGVRKTTIENAVESTNVVNRLNDKVNVFFNGAWAHQCIFRGKDLTAYMDSGEMSAAIADGSFTGIYIGDYVIKPISIDGITYNVKWEVADLDYFLFKGDGNNLTMNHHIVLLPSTVIQTNVSMNNINTTENGYFGTKMLSEVIPKYTAAVIFAFGESHVLIHREALTNAVDVNVDNRNAILKGASISNVWTDVAVNIPSERMVYGSQLFGSSSYDSGNKETQLAIFRYKTIYEGRKWFWLQDVASASAFAAVYDSGTAGFFEASTANEGGGICPYFLYY
jgi:hypothetical protein